MYTHRIKSSGQKCFQAAWWPTRCEAAMSRERKWPLMYIEGGQIARVRADNLRKIEQQ